ncbi:ABC transporter ATP-binding protein [Actinoallomurus acaciae]|uniref:ABC transporter ATP-binding protein n=1 Tax=Actinoallomurus acaciae TaxID=502577 RepID=A0ABV5YJF6_9ACTN
MTSKTLLGRLYAAVGTETAPALRRQIVRVAVYAVLQGVTFVLMVPALRALLRHDTGTAWAWIGVMTVSAAATLVARHLQSMGGFRVGMATINGLHHRLGDHLATLPLGWFSADRTGRLTRLIGQGAKDVSGIIAHLLEPLLTGTLTPLVVVAGVFVFDWRIGLTLLICAPVLYAVHRWTTRLAERVDDRLEETASEANGRVVEFARAQPVLRASGPGGPGLVLLDDALEEQDRATRRRARADAPARMLFGLTVQLGVAAALVTGTAHLLGGGDPATTIATLVLVVRFAEPVTAIAGLAGTFRSSRAALAGVTGVLDARPLPEPDRTAEEAPARTPGSAVAVELRDVSFGYAPDRTVLDGVTFTAEAGTTVALVGASGSGKTTVTRLVARFFDVGSGSVHIGGDDVRDLTTDELAGMLAMVFQDVYLFDGTIRENIRVARPDAGEEEVERVARLARVDDIVTRLPDGWDTRVGEGGAALSGGERQRVSLARALLKDAPVVLLDEATASLDAENQAAIQRALADLSGRSTLLVVAHRLETITTADRIVVLGDGRVAESGTHEELMALNGRYAAFWRERNRSLGWRLATAEEVGAS